MTCELAKLMAMAAIDGQFIFSGEVRIWAERFGAAARLLRHLAERAGRPQTTREEYVAANLETWRVINGDVRPFGERAARCFVEATYDRTADPAAALNHDRAARRMTPDRLVPLSSITAPTQVVHGTADPLRPLPHGEAVAALIPHARLRTIPGMGHGFFSPGIPERTAEMILEHTALAVRSPRPC